MRVRYLVICAGALSWATLTGWASPATRPAGQAADKEPTTKPADRLAGFVRAVIEADEPRAAMRAYARGCAVSRGGTELHDAYMQRMLKFGLPKIAHYPARVLVRLDPDNALAWGLVGYTHGKHGELTEAFSATIRSLEKLRDDPSVLHNAGQLVAWYDNEPDLPRLPDRARRSLARMKEELVGKKPYAEAYEAIKGAYARRASKVEQLDKKVAVAEAELLAARQIVLEIECELRELNDEIERRDGVINDLWRELRLGYVYYYRDNDGRRIYRYRRHHRYYRDDLYDRMHQEERAVERLKSQRSRLRSRGKSVLVELKGKEAALSRFRRRLRQAKARVERTFRWDPPAVDGVVTPEADFFPTATRPAAPADPEDQAAQRLDLARLYIRHEMNEKAARILQDLLIDYGSTKAAGEAKKLLVSLGPVE